ncbi:MAG: methyltransferase domain-containing protein [Planctomycetes bacterium]|nr:methyltransferase domain-containing protein [Planctomycetota bacterium]
MSTENSLLLKVVPPGTGSALDLGGSLGLLRTGLEALGYRYVNLDLGAPAGGGPTCRGDAHRLPLRGASLSLVASKDTLEHFVDPQRVVSEVLRVLRPGGLFVIWVPFLHPFHATDYWRYTPLALRMMLREFEILSFESPHWVFTVVGLAAVEALKRIHLGFLDRPVRRLCGWLDGICMAGRTQPASFAAAYRIVARRTGPPS